MTKYYRKVLNILNDEGLSLKKESIERIRRLYPLFSIDEMRTIGDIEESIAQIETEKKPPISRG
tara:strand:- start:303 stop:494 length:192 start_codon:yes stop_codon:yes gene_type:complete